MKSVPGCVTTASAMVTDRFELWTGDAVREHGIRPGLGQDRFEGGQQSPGEVPQGLTVGVARRRDRRPRRSSPSRGSSVRGCCGW